MRARCDLDVIADDPLSLVSTLETLSSAPLEAMLYIFYKSRKSRRGPSWMQLSRLLAGFRAACTVPLQGRATDSMRDKNGRAHSRGPPAQLIRGKHAHCRCFLQRLRNQRVVITFDINSNKNDGPRPMLRRDNDKSYFSFVTDTNHRTVSRPRLHRCCSDTQ